MTRVNLEVETWFTREPDPNDRWDIGERDGRVNDIYISYSDYDYGYNGFETELEPPFFVVYATWQTGCTFGFDFEAGIVGVHKTIEEAESLRDEARNFNSYGKLSSGFRVPWNGYFERLLMVDIKRLA